MKIQQKSKKPGYLREASEQGVKVIFVDGGKRLLADLDLIYPGARVQRYRAHKNRNVLNFVRRADGEGEKVNKNLHKIQYASVLR